jgi:phage/plasmid-associated DNA primase
VLQSGEVEHKFSFAVIGERNSGKGTIQAAATSAFGAIIISSGFNANNLMGTDTTVDEAKKYMFLCDAGETGSRIVWPNEIRTVIQKGETFIDGNLFKGIASGGYPLAVRGNYHDLSNLRHEFTMFLNVNDLPVTGP